MRQNVKFKLIHAGAFKSFERTMELAVEFANGLEPHQLITLNITMDGKIVVWYRDR